MKLKQVENAQLEQASLNVNSFPQNLTEASGTIGTELRENAVYPPIDMPLCEQNVGKVCKLRRLRKCVRALASE